MIINGTHCTTKWHPTKTTCPVVVPDRLGEVIKYCPVAFSTALQHNRMTKDATKVP